MSTRKQTASTEQRYSRRFPRHRFDARIQVSVFRHGATTTCWGRTNEVGEDGIGATLSGQLHSGEVVSLEFPIPIPPQLMQLRAVVRYNDGLRCGFEFLVLTHDQKRILRQLNVVLANASDSSIQATLPQ